MNISKDKALDDAEFAALEYIDKYRCKFEVNDAWMWFVVRQNQIHNKEFFLKKSDSNISDVSIIVDSVNDLPKRVRRYYEAYVVSVTVVFPIITYGKGSNAYGYTNKQAVASLVDSIEENFYHRLDVLKDYEISRCYTRFSYNHYNDTVICKLLYLPLDKSKLYNRNSEIKLRF